jgi:hypothetical protein
LTGISPDSATLEIQVEETIERDFPNVSYVVPTVASGPQIVSSPLTLTVTIVGARSLVEAVVPERIRVRLPSEAVNSLSPGQEARVEPVVEGLPPLLEAVVDPRQVTLRRPVGL